MKVRKTTTNTTAAKPLRKRGTEKAGEWVELKQLLKAEADGWRRVEAEAAELAKLSPGKLISRWYENEKKRNRSRHCGNIFNASWHTLCQRSWLLEELIAREQTSAEGLLAKLRFLEEQIDVDDEDSRMLARSCWRDAEQILDIPF